MSVSPKRMQFFLRTHAINVQEQDVTFALRAASESGAPVGGKDFFMVLVSTLGRNVDSAFCTVMEENYRKFVKISKAE